MPIVCIRWDLASDPRSGLTHPPIRLWVTPRHFAAASVSARGVRSRELGTTRQLGRNLDVITRRNADASLLARQMSGWLSQLLPRLFFQ